MNGKKISLQAAGAALAAITVWLIHGFTPLKVPPEVAVAFGTVYSVAVAYFTPDEKEDA